MTDQLKIKSSLTAEEKLQRMAKHANDDVINAHNQLMRAQAYSRALYKITSSDLSTDQKVEKTVELRKERKKSYECLGNFLTYANNI